MIKKASILLVALFIFSTSFAQNNKIEEYVKSGIDLHDNGDYKGAIEQYKKALEIDKTSSLANYEISSSYFAMKDFKNAIKHSDVVIDNNSNYVDQAFILKGSAQDIVGERKDAIKTYKKGIRKFPDNHLLHYNLALTYYQDNQNDDAVESLQQALKIKSTHATSHLLLGYIMMEQGNRVQSILALYNYLLLEPTTNRSKDALQKLNKQLGLGVEKKDNNTINISIPASGKNDDFGAANLMISLLQATKNSKENEGKSEYEIISKNTKSTFSILSELKKKNKGFWWEFYVDFFSEFNESEIETMTYYINQSTNDAQVITWLESNPSRVDKLMKRTMNAKRIF